MNFRSYNHLNDFHKLVSKSFNGGSIYLAGEGSLAHGRENILEGGSIYLAGSGIVDTLLKPFTAERYPGERHAYSLAPSTFGKPMNFMGPFTSLKDRLNTDLTPKQYSLPLNSADKSSMFHDISLLKAKKNSKQTQQQKTEKNS